LSSYLDVVAAYDGQADMLAERYEAVSSEQILAEVLPVIPDGRDCKLRSTSAPALDVTRPG
jgi:hypothetical protein